jgi:hypothetical protein
MVNWRKNIHYENATLWDGHRVTLVRVDVLEERIASIFKVERIRELGITLAVTSNCDYAVGTVRLRAKSYGDILNIVKLFLNVMHPAH